MARWDLNLRNIYSPDEPNFRDAFGNALVSELERQRQLRIADQEMRNRLATTPGVTFERPVRADTTPKPQPIPVMPKPQYDHATGKLTGLVDAGPGATLAGVPRPTVNPNESPLDQALAALSPTYNEIRLPGGGSAYVDANYGARKDLERVSLVGRQQRYEQSVTAQDARDRAVEEYGRLVSTNPADTRLGRALRSITPEVWANNPTLRDDILKQGNQLSPEEAEANRRSRDDETWNNRFRLQSSANEAALARTLATIAGANQRTASTQEAVNERSRQDRRLRKQIAQIRTSQKGTTGANVWAWTGRIPPGQTGAATAPAGAPDPMAMMRQIAAEPAMAGQPSRVIAENARYRRTQQIIQEDPDITPAEIQEQLEDEGFYGPAR